MSIATQLSFSTATSVLAGTAGALLYQQSVGATTFLPIASTSGWILQSTGSIPQWTPSSVGAATNLAGGIASQIPYQTGAGATSFIANGTAGTVLTSNGTAVPSWNNTLTLASTNQAGTTNTGALVVPFGGVGIGGNLVVGGSSTITNSEIILGTTQAATTITGALQVRGGVGIGGNIVAGGVITATNFSGSLSGGTAMSLVYQSAANTTAFLSASSTSGWILSSQGTGAVPLWIPASGVASGSATNLAGGIASQIPYQTGAGATSFIANGTAGTILTSNGTAVPSWNSTLTLASTNQSASTNTGALIVPFGGVGIGGNLVVGGNSTITNSEIILGTTAATSTATGALQVRGGVGIGGNLYVGGNTVVTGNLTIQGTTVIVDSTVTNIADPIFILGTTASGGVQVVDDNKDRGIAFYYFSSTNKIGFFGYDDSTNFWTYVPDATITGEIVSGTKGAVDVNLAGGTAQSVVYQSAANTTAFLAASSTSGWVLQSLGTGAAPVWGNPAGISAGSATAADTVKTVYQATTATYYPLFVDSNNASATAENVYTTASIFLNPSSASMELGNILQSYNVTGGSNYNLRLNGLDYTSIVFHDSGNTIGNLKFSATNGFEIGAPDGTYGPHNTRIQGSTDATSTATGGLNVPFGGVGVGKAIYAGGGATAQWFTANGSAPPSASTVNLSVYSSGAWLNSPSGTTAYLATNGSGILSWTSSAITALPSTNATSTATGALVVPYGGVGIGRDLWVGGGVYATTKSFLIDHPTKPGMKLRYGSLEGPENGVYVRGKLTEGNTIQLPDYWTGLVDPDSITVTLTPIGKFQKLYVESIVDNKVVVGIDGMFSKTINCFYTVWAERKDVDKLVVEYE